MAVNFLEKLNFMMGKSGLTKYSLSKASGIPYTTVDGWYKKKCEGPKLNTLRKLAKYFETSIDFWVDDGSAEELLDDGGGRRGEGAPLLFFAGWGPVAKGVEFW